MATAGAQRKQSKPALRLRYASADDLDTHWSGLRYDVKYDPNQPRDPAGTPTGGQWTSHEPAEGGPMPDDVADAPSMDKDEYGLTPDEYDTMQRWLGSGYRELRTDPEFGKILEKLPLFNGKVYRGARVRLEDLDKI